MIFSTLRSDFSSQLHLYSTGTMTPTCSSCDKPVHKNRLQICCSTCEKLFHASCVNIKPKEYRQQYKNNQSQWNCLTCSLPFMSCGNMSFEEAFVNVTPKFNNDINVSNLTDDDNPHPKAKHLISCMLFNSQSIRNKQQELIAIIETNDLDIVCITETWFSPEDTDLISSIPGYSALRTDRTTNTIGSGVMILAKEALNLTQLYCTHPFGIEILCASITTKDAKWLISLLYRPPNTGIPYGKITKCM